MSENKRLNPNVGTKPCAYCNKRSRRFCSICGKYACPEHLVRLKEYRHQERCLKCLKVNKLS